MRHRFHTSPEIISRINVTPIIDVALVLVIILLVTAPLISVADLGVTLPQARTREAEDERNVCITISRDGKIALGEHILGAGMLTASLREELSHPGNANVLVVVRADSSAPYAAVRQVLEQARAAGAHRLAIATRQKIGRTG